MKQKRILMTVLISIVVVCTAGLTWAVPMGTAFTYRGFLMDKNQPADGLYDFEFALYDANDLGYQQGSTINKDNVELTDGHFMVLLDFAGEDPNVFNGDSRWLQLAVRPGSSNDPCDFVTLSPRTQLSPTPYAIYAASAGADEDWMVFGNDIYSIPSGNVGIGTTIPSEKLEVNGTVNATAFVGDGSGLTGIAIAETDPTVLASVKDGIDWSEVSSRPAGLDDGDDVGITSETDPTVLASVKDGVSWTEVANIPAGFADNVDNIGIAAETDPTVPASVKDGISWSEVSSRPAGLDDGDDVGITSETDTLQSVCNRGSSSSTSVDISGTSSPMLDVTNTNGIGGNAIMGHTAGDSPGVRGSSNKGHGIYGITAAESRHGVYGNHNSTVNSGSGGYFRTSHAGSPALWAYSKDGTNYGFLCDGYEVVNGPGNNNGIYVTNSSDYYPTIWARNTNSDGGNCIHAKNDSSSYPTLYVQQDGSNWAGWFEGALGCSGTKSAVVDTKSYGNRLFYADESAEIYFFDRGYGELTNGSCVINLDPMFLETVTVDTSYPMLVQITLTADCKGVFVSDKTNSSFTVTELQRGKSNATFDWEVAAKRKGYEDVRMEKITVVEQSKATPLTSSMESAGVGAGAPSGGVRIVRGD